MLGPNARMTLTEISDRISVSVPVINYHIKKMMQAGIIRGFRVNIDISKIGYNIIRVFLYLNDFTLKEKISDYARLNPYLVFIDRYAGDADLDLEFHLENIGQLHHIMQDIMKKFPNAIRNYRHYAITKYHKFLYMPEE